MNYRIFYFSTNHLQTGCMEKSNFGFFELRKKNSDPLEYSAGAEISTEKKVGRFLSKMWRF